MKKAVGHVDAPCRSDPQSTTAPLHIKNDVHVTLLLRNYLI